jgi:hypothetical protein
MGGGIELEFPAYHIFTAQIMLLTGLPNYVAQATVAALFSSLTILAIFLITKAVWTTPAALIAAALITVSRTDIEILCWGGYPNIIALMLIPLFFYLILKRDTLPKAAYLATTSLIAAAILFGHSLSLAVFLAITATTLLAILVFPKTLNEPRKSILKWLLPLLIGGLLVSPFLVSAVQPYLNESATLLGAPAIQQALLVHRTVSLELTLALFGFVMLFFVLSKKYNGRFLSFPAFLIIMWLFVPLLLTQDYLFGVYLDSVRFLYFLMYPLLILFAVTIDYSIRAFPKIFDAYQKSNIALTNPFLKKMQQKIIEKKAKAIFNGILLATVLIISLSLPIFSYPWEGIKIQQFYQNIDQEGYRAIQWIKQNTANDSVFVAQMGYGWWLAGVGQRPTLTNVDLQASTLAREVSISQNVSYLLDTDYLIDNGLLQVREDGAYLDRHNPRFLADVKNTNSPSEFFQFNSSKITLLYHDENNAKGVTVAELPVTDMALLGAKSDSPFIIVNRANSVLSYSETITLKKDSPYANLTITLQSRKPNFSLDSINFTVASPGKFQQPSKNTLTTLDSTTNTYGQLTFNKSPSMITPSNSQTPSIAHLFYSLEDKSSAQIEILFAISQSSDQQNNLTAAHDLPPTTFDYQTALKQYNVSYVANRAFELNSKYAEDPQFSLVFINSEVAVFKVETNQSRNS